MHGVRAMEPADSTALLGLPKLDATPSGRLVRLADLVVWLASRDELPIQTAVGIVLDTVEKHIPAFCETRPGQYAAIVNGAHFEDAPMFGLFLNCDADSTDEQIKAAVISDLRTKWFAARMAADLSGRYAIREGQAEKCFGYPATGTARLPGDGKSQAGGAADMQTPAHATLLRSVTSGRASGMEADDEVKTFKATKHPGEDWTADDYAELLRQYDTITAKPRGMKAELAKHALAGVWGIKPASVHVYLTKARAAGQGQGKRRTG